MARKVKVGVVGVGNIGTHHVQDIGSGKIEELELVAVADINPDRLKWTRENIGEHIKTYNTAEELFDSKEVEAVIIAVPHYFHPPYAIACMERGLHVMVEKPAGVYVKQVIEMNDVAKKHPDVVFGMMFNQRTNCVYRKMRELVQSGKYGQIRRTNWLITNWYRPQFYYDSGNWRATWAGEGGGVLMNQCPHQIDLWQWICGMPVKVHSKVKYGKWHDIEVEDDVTAYVEYANGATGVFITSTGDACGSNRFEIQMDKAQLVVENDKLKVTEFDITEQEFSKECKTSFGKVPMHEIEVETDGENPQHAGVLKAWAAAILRGEPLVAPGVEGINGVTISNAIHLSSWLNREVEIPFDNELYYEELKKRIATSKIKTSNVSVVADTSDTFAGTK